MVVGGADTGCASSPQRNPRNLCPISLNDPLFLSLPSTEGQAIDGDKVSLSATKGGFGGGKGEEGGRRGATVEEDRPRKAKGERRAEAAFKGYI